MIPLDNFDDWAGHLDRDARQYLTELELQRYQSIPASERLNQLRAILQKPIAHFSPVNEVFFRARWANVLETIQAGKDLTLLEVASGDSDPIPQMMARRYPNGRYIAANMNRRLTESLQERTQELPIEISVIEEDAARIGDFLPAGSVDLIAFQHGVNDVIQAILCEQEGLDTIYTDWMAVLPGMIRIMQQEIAQNTLEQHASPAFQALLHQLLLVLKPGGFIVINHYMFQLDLDWGYPPELWENLIPIVRQWMSSLSGGKEVIYPDFNPHWWIFYQKE